MNQFDIPVALFMFKRKDTLLRIIKVLSIVKPQKLFLISDEGRNIKEKTEVAETRKAVEEAINWNCAVIKYYASDNRGVYKNIAGGAKWVFSQEEKAIFLEDDNLPEITFFEYCKELLDLYRDDERILWICGTNYLSEYHQYAEEPPRLYGSANSSYGTFVSPVVHSGGQERPRQILRNASHRSWRRSTASV